jgi:predicted DNA-binding transcriptional regulator YafY
MRADRLLALLMLLQVKGKLSARQLAAELDVSERTIYRDVEALSMAGIPIYGEPGREGGFALVDRYRTTLTGLSDAQVQALFMLSIPAPLADLGLGQEARAALLKVLAALPGDHRADERRVRQCFFLDAVGWDRGDEAVPHLPTIHEAVWQDRQLRIAYRIGPLAAELEQQVEPFGLVAKAGIWHLVYRRGEALRVQRVSHLVSARLAEETFERPTEFDLAEFWQRWCAQQEASRSLYTVRARIAPRLVPELPRLLGDHLRQRIATAGPADADGWITLDLTFDSLESAREHLLSLGGSVEVLEPHALRASLADYARQIVDLYAGVRIDSTRQLG